MDPILQFQLQSIFSPRSAEKRRPLFEEQRKVAHYTTADNAMRILRGKEVWLRNVRYMNDFQEFTHGFDMMLRFFSSTSDGQEDLGRRELFSALNSVYPGLVDRIIANFNSWLSQLREQTYVTCVSEHLPEEDDIGRLSMWRGYSYSAPPVALVINPDVFFTTTDEIGAYSSPVIYQTSEQFFEGMRQTSAAILDNAELLRSVGEPVVDGFLFQALVHYAVCQKHRGFAEEREWRIMHIPRLHPSGVMTRATESIRNRPQLVYKLPLRDDYADGLASVPKLLNKIIVGPTDEPWQLHEAFVAILEEAGVEHADKKVVVSDIPFRNGL